MTGREIRRAAWTAAKGRRIVLLLYTLIVMAPGLIVQAIYGLRGTQAPSWLMTVIAIGYSGMLSFGLRRISLDIWQGKETCIGSLGFAFTDGNFRVCFPLSFVLWLAGQIISYLTGALFCRSGPGLWVGSILSMLMNFLWTSVSFPVAFRAVLRASDGSVVQLREGLELGRDALWEIMVFHLWVQLPLWVCIVLLILSVNLFPAAGAVISLAFLVFSLFYLPYLNLALAGFAQSLIDPAPVEEYKPPRPMKLSGRGGGWYWCSLSEGPRKRSWPPERGDGTEGVPL